MAPPKGVPTVPTLHDVPAAQLVNTLNTAATAQLESVVAAHLGLTFPALAITVLHAGEVLLNVGGGLD